MFEARKAEKEEQRIRNYSQEDMALKAGLSEDSIDIGLNNQIT